MEESIKKAVQKTDDIRKMNGESVMKPYSYSPLSLAYIGDSVFDLMIKTYFVSGVNMQTQKYHKEVSKIVRAGSQAQLIDRLIAENALSEDEMDVFRRGRNATTHTKAKNASMMEYRKATGFEALIGYLYLNGNTERLNEIFCLVLEMTRPVL